VTEREKNGIKLLLSQPEIVAWLELSERQIVAWLKPYENKDDDGRGAEGGVVEPLTNAFESGEWDD
jgi:hypothetical protein